MPIICDVKGAMLDRRDRIYAELGVPSGEPEDYRALAILQEWVKATGAKMNEARLRMTRILKGADAPASPNTSLALPGTSV